jgi:hypothetical protein
MPDAAKYDLNLRPESYWPFNQPRAGKHTNEFERRLAEACVTGNVSRIGFPPVEFALRGGDFLPEFARHEVEIARLALNSTTWDVDSIRARPRGKRIYYRVVTEYPEMQVRCTPKSSIRPLSFGELIQLIEGLTCGEYSLSPRGCRESGCGDLDTVEEIRDAVEFVRVTSDFYPELERWYDEEAEEWAAQRIESLTPLPVGAIECHVSASEPHPLAGERQCFFWSNGLAVEIQDDSGSGVRSYHPHILTDDGRVGSYQVRDYAGRVLTLRPLRCRGL